MSHESEHRDAVVRNNERMRIVLVDERGKIATRKRHEDTHGKLAIVDSLV